jgi:hypothetical protein
MMAGSSFRVTSSSGEQRRGSKVAVPEGDAVTAAGCGEKVRLGAGVAVFVAVAGRLVPVGAEVGFAEGLGKAVVSEAGITAA